MTKARPGRLSRFCRAQRGASAVEFALILPVFLAIVFGIVVFGSYLAVVHGVQHVFHDPVALDRWPDADRRSRLVFITRGLDPRYVRELFEAFAGLPAPDRPDAAALADNPLRPFGGPDH